MDRVQAIHTRALGREGGRHPRQERTAALRTVIGQMFVSVQLGPSGGVGHARARLAIGEKQQRYWLFPNLRWSAAETAMR